MARARRDERLLSKDEQELVAQTRHPIIKNLDSAEVLNIIKHLRERHDRACEIGRYKRRELRGQAALSGLTRASGTAASESDGHRAKRTLLSAALKRANKETEHRRAAKARNDLVRNAKTTLRTKKAADIGTPRPPTHTSYQDMQPIPDTDIPRSGALSQETPRPVLESSHKVR